MSFSGRRGSPARPKLPIGLFLAEGALVWWIYALLESAALTVSQRWPKRPAVNADPAVAILSLIGYVTIGGLLSVAISSIVFFFTRRTAGYRRQCQAVVGAALSVLVVHFVTVVLLAIESREGLITYLTHGSVLVPIAQATTFSLFALAVAVKGASVSTRACTEMSRWICSLALICVGGLTQSTMFYRSNSEKLALAAAFTACIPIWYFVATKRLRAHGNASRRMLVQSLSLATPAVFALAIALRPNPTEAVPPLHGWALGRPNVVLVTLDTVRADHLSVYGYGRPTTPNLNDFAASAVTYTHAVAASDMTLASHASIFTGLYPQRHGAHRTRMAPWGSPLSATEVTLASILQKRGYATLAVGANDGFLDADFGLGQGFQYYDVRPPANPFAAQRILSARQLMIRALRPLLSRHDLESVYRSAAAITDAAISVLDRDRSARPVFLFLNYMDAHDPYVPPAPFDELFDQQDGSVVELNLEILKARLSAVHRDASESERMHLTARYDGAIRYIDAQLGVLFEKLRKRDLYDSSLIIVTSDHGEAFGERGELGHDISVYRHQVDIPLLIKYPNSTTREVRVDNVSHTDIMPTVLGVLGFDVPDGLQGRDVAVQDAAAIVFSESYQKVYEPPWPARAARDTRRAAVRWPLKFVTGENGMHELFDLSIDPAESRDLCIARPDVVKRFEALLALGLPDGAAVPTPRQVAPETLERLRALGYLK